MVSFKIVGEIQTKQRPRATIRGGYARVYTPKDKNFYHKVYLCYGMLCQVQDLQEFCLFIKENTTLEYESSY